MFGQCRELMGHTVTVTRNIAENKDDGLAAKQP